MTILNTLTLPSTSDGYFTFYHTRAYDPALDRNKPTQDNMADIIKELNLAETKYPDRSFRIGLMRHWVKMGFNKRVIQSNKENVLETLF